MMEKWTSRFNSALINVPIEFQKSIVLFDHTNEYLIVYRKEKVQSKDYIRDDSFVLQRSIETGEIKEFSVRDIFSIDLLKQELKHCQNNSAFIKKKIKYLRIYDELYPFKNIKNDIERKKFYLDFRSLILSLYDEDEMTLFYNQLCPMMLDYVQSIIDE